MEYVVRRESDLSHSGVKGQKWGIRRYQNEDGSLTAEGKERYGDQRGYEARQMYKAGTISKSEMRKRTKSDGVYGKVRTVATLGLGGRRVSEFRQRHEKGLTVAAGLLAGGIAAASVAKMSTMLGASKGQAATAALLRGAVSGGLAAGGAWVSNRINDAVVNRSMNKNTYKNKH